MKFLRVPREEEEAVVLPKYKESDEKKARKRKGTSRTEKKRERATKIGKSELGCSVGR